MTVAFGTPGIGEIAVILVLGLLLFGSKQLPQIAKTLGSAIRELKSVMRSVSDDDTDRDH